MLNNVFNCMHPDNHHTKFAPCPAIMLWLSYKTVHEMRKLCKKRAPANAQIMSNLVVTIPWNKRHNARPK